MEFLDMDKEWHNSILIMIVKVLNMKIKPVIIYNRELFDSYEPKGEYNKDEVWGECIDNTGLIWLSEDLSTRPKTLTLNTLYHECLHIKYPSWDEEKIRITADSVIPIQ